MPKILKTVSRLRDTSSPSLGKPSQVQPTNGPSRRPYRSNQLLIKKHGRELVRFCAKTFNNINGRCNIKTTNKYEYYGGRGIKNLLTVEDVVSLAIRDRAMSMERPSIDRIDSTGHYSFKNCRFVELIKNIKSRTYKSIKKPYTPKNKLINVLKILNISELCRRLSVEPYFLFNMTNLRTGKSQADAERIIKFINSISSLTAISFEDAFTDTSK